MDKLKSETIDMSANENKEEKIKIEEEKEDGPEIEVIQIEKDVKEAEIPVIISEKEEQDNLLKKLQFFKYLTSDIDKIYQENID